MTEPLAVTALFSLGDWKKSCSLGSSFPFRTFRTSSAILADRKSFQRTNDEKVVKKIFTKPASHQKPNDCRFYYIVITIFHPRCRRTASTLDGL